MGKARVPLDPQIREAGHRPPCHIPKPCPVPPSETRGAKIYETNLRCNSRRLDCDRPLRWACVCRAGGRARFRARRHDGLRLTPRRLWATTAAVLALVGVIVGG